LDNSGTISKFTRVLGQKQYEIQDHLGNVKVVFNDYKEPVSGGSGSEKYDLNVLSLLNYYPFGMSMPGMGYEAGGSRYGFNGHEQDDEVSGVGNHVSFGNQGYSPRLGKRWNQDKVEHIDFSPYVTFANDPVNKADLDGNQETRAGIMLRQAEESYLKTGDRKQIDDLYTGNAVGAVMGVIAIALPETIPLMLRNPVRTVNTAVGVGSFAIGLVDEGNQINLPGKIDDAGRVTTGVVKKIVKKVSDKWLKSTKKITKANTTKGWKVGDPINNLTKKGNVPKWSTVRQRYWKNRALNSKKGEFSEDNLKLMKKGNAPLVKNPKTGKMESVELHHDPSQKEGGLFDVIEVTPEQHSKIDKHRKLKKGN